MQLADNPPKLPRNLGNISQISLKNFHVEPTEQILLEASFLKRVVFIIEKYLSETRGRRKRRERILHRFTSFFTKLQT